MRRRRRRTSRKAWREIWLLRDRLWLRWMRRGDGTWSIVRRRSIVRRGDHVQINIGRISITRWRGRRP